MSFCWRGGKADRGLFREKLTRFDGKISLKRLINQRFLRATDFLPAAKLPERQKDLPAAELPERQKDLPGGPDFV